MAVLDPPTAMSGSQSQETRAEEITARIAEAEAVVREARREAGAMKRRATDHAFKLFDLITTVEEFAGHVLEGQEAHWAPVEKRIREIRLAISQSK